MNEAWAWIRAVAPVVSAVVALVALAFTIHHARKAAAASAKAGDYASQANEHSKRANTIAEGQAHRGLRNLIMSAKTNLDSVIREMEAIRKGRAPDELLPEECKCFAAIHLRYDSALEDYLNAYESACGCYLDGSVSKERFKKDFIREIGNLMEKKPTSQLLASPATKYNAIRDSCRAP